MWGFGTLEHNLNQVLFNWSQYDPFRVRDLLNGGVLILARRAAARLPAAAENWDSRLSTTAIPVD